MTPNDQLVETLFDTQKILEGGSAEWGIKKYKDTLREARQKGKDLTTFAPEAALLAKAMPKLTDAIVTKMLTHQHGGNRRINFGKLLKGVIPEHLAFIALRHAFNHWTGQDTAQNTAVKLGTAIAAHIDYLVFKKECPGYVHVLERALQASTQVHRHRVITHARRRLQIKGVEWDEKIKYAIGSNLLGLLIDATGLFELSFYWKNRKKYRSFKATEKTMEWLDKHHEKLQVLSPVYQPMVMEPIDWDSPIGGGYICVTEDGEQTLPDQWILRTMNKAAMARLFDTDVDLSEVYAALNVLQRTPYRINKKVLEVFAELIGSGLVGLPDEKKVELLLPPKPWFDDAEFLRMKKAKDPRVDVWCAEASRIYDSYHREVSKRQAVRFQHLIAQKFKDYERIYFPHSLDWRGRAYPIPVGLNPQSDDSGKALLEFADGKRLGDRGAFWLAVHGANCFGEDKVSFEDRVQWVHDHEDEIINAAQYPIDGQRWWMQADEPFQFLAFCFEWCAFLQNGYDYVSHLIVCQDASCSGTQHFSAMMKDEVGAKAVNLLPADKPADIYNSVAEVSSTLVEKDASSGDDRAKAWLGRINRKITKRNTMTLPYGATVNGFQDQLDHELRKFDQEGERYLGDTGVENWQAASYLASVNRMAISQVVKKAVEVMDWLQEIVKIITDAEFDFRFKTPVGLPVMQNYLSMKSKRIETYWGSTRLKLTLGYPGKRLNKSKMVNGSSPNFIHAHDAAHLMKIALYCKAKGLSHFKAVHDSFGVHACDVDILREAFQETMIEMYSEDRISKLLDDLESYLPEEVFHSLPVPPAPGSFDLNEIRRSAFCLS